MQILEFDPIVGRYHFQESNVVTGLHAHPALELLIAVDGRFNLRGPGQELENLQMAVVAPNQLHALEAHGCALELIMVEPGWQELDQILQNIAMTADAMAGMWALDPLVHAAPVRALLAHPVAKGTRGLDARVQAAQQFIAQALGDPGLTLAQVAAQAHLSPGRLSHLFKSAVGVSVREYIVWCRMKHAIHRLLIEEANLTQAAHAAGFHDSAHFSKHFKALFGMSPSTVYNNSRIVQARLTDEG